MAHNYTAQKPDNWTTVTVAVPQNCYFCPMKGKILGSLFALPFFSIGVWMLWSISSTLIEANTAIQLLGKEFGLPEAANDPQFRRAAGPAGAQRHDSKVNLL